MTLYGWALVFLLGATLSVYARSVSVGNTNLGITGGTPTTIDKHPYQAALIMNGKLIGAGAIVGKKFVLTTAYLAESYTFQVRVASTSSTEGGQLLNVAKKILHPKYKYQRFNVALLILSENIEYGKDAKPIRLAKKEGRNTTAAVLTGYGTESARMMGASSGSLQEGTQNVVDRTTCQTQYNVVTLDQSNSCAYNKNVCACFDDGGDPLVQRNQLLGLNLGVVACCNPDMAQLYASVPACRKWVIMEMKEEGFREADEVGHYYDNKEV